MKVIQIEIWSYLVIKFEGSAINPCEKQIVVSLAYQIHVSQAEPSHVHQNDLAVDHAYFLINARCKGCVPYESGIGMGMDTEPISFAHASTFLKMLHDDL